LWKLVKKSMRISFPTKNLRKFMRKISDLDSEIFFSLKVFKLNCKNISVKEQLCSKRNKLTNKESFVINIKRLT